MKPTTERYKQMQLVASYIPMCNCGVTVEMLARDCFPMMANSLLHIHNAEGRVRQALSDISSQLGLAIHRMKLPSGRHSIWIDPTEPNKRILNQIVMQVIEYEQNPQNDGVPYLDPTTYSKPKAVVS